MPMLVIRIPMLVAYGVVLPRLRRVSGQFHGSLRFSPSLINRDQSEDGDGNEDEDRHETEGAPRAGAPHRHDGWDGSVGVVLWRAATALVFLPAAAVAGLVSGWIRLWMGWGGHDLLLKPF